VPELGHPGYEKQYMQGKAPDGSPAPEHQKKLALAEFRAGSERDT
jgi:hypothetical protein